MTDAPRLRVRHENLTWRRVSEEIIILDLDRSVYLALNLSAATLWECLVDGATPDDLVQLLTSEFGVDQIQARSDVDAFLDHCLRENLVETEG
jgi:hypothetical protein